VLIAMSHVGLGVACLCLGALELVYSFSRLSTSEQAGWLLPGPPWLRRSMAAATGAFLLMFGVVALVGY
jgi:uncharacterized membrane protein HdeD (DUF308 family)